MRLRSLAIAAVSVLLGTAGAQALPTMWAGNGHYYELVSPTSGINWFDANTAASGSSYMGQTGYLATITSAEEQSFLNGLISGTKNIWLGGSNATSGGTWEWVSTGEAWGFENWRTNEPNNYGGNEHYLLGWFNGSDPTWVDTNGSLAYYIAPRSYLVEYAVAAVPLPAALPLAMSGFAVFGLLATRRRAKTA